jgi:hypothetical protein
MSVFLALHMTNKNELKYLTFENNLQIDQLHIKLPTASFLFDLR